MGLGGAWHMGTQKKIYDLDLFFFFFFFLSANWDVTGYLEKKGWETRTGDFEILHGH